MLEECRFGGLCIPPEEEEAGAECTSPLSFLALELVVAAVTDGVVAMGSREAVAEDGSVAVLVGAEVDVGGKGGRLT